MYNSSVDFVFSDKVSDSDQLRKVADYIECSHGRISHKFKSSGRVILTAWHPKCYEQLIETINKEAMNNNLKIK